MTDSAQPADMTASERDAYEELLVALDSRALYLRELFGIFSETDVSALTGHDPRTLTVWRTQKRGPDAVKLGRAVFYRREDIQAWIAANVMPMDRVMSA
jgi:predicted DNA-binding transcriptional regulator AlpA